MAFAEPIDAFFADFGVDATLNGQPVRGIFDAPGSEHFGILGATSPVFRCSDSAVATVGSSLVIGAKTYAVAEFLPDGTGIVELRLK